MPFAPVLRTGTLPLYDLNEELETGILVESISFTPMVDVRNKEAHASSAALNQIVQRRTTNKGLTLDIKGSIIPDGNGLPQGIAKAYVGEAVTCAHFASSGDQSMARHGYTRDDTKALLVTEIKTDLGNTNPADVTIKLDYLPYCSLS